MTANNVGNNVISIFQGTKLAPFIPGMVAANTAPILPTPPRVSKPNGKHDDFDFARGSLISVISDGQQAIAELANIAARSQHPRAYEVLGGLIDSLVNASTELLTLQQKDQEIKQVANGGPETVNNNLFVGSTTELQRLITEMKKNREPT